mmetsp:Transcript_9482/g.12734  ORF Transcript_9482/g.12734 Transcript_9482/m.12734 type:complete len:93 (+) Transcript_9482:401-679(+)
MYRLTHLSMIHWIWFCSDIGPLKHNDQTNQKYKHDHIAKLMSDMLHLSFFCILFCCISVDSLFETGGWKQRYAGKSTIDCYIIILQNDSFSV